MLVHLLNLLDTDTCMGLAQTKVLKYQLLFAILGSPMINRKKVDLPQSSRGFTIIEIISITAICCAILGGLINFYQKYQRKLKTAEIPLIMNMISQAELRYYQNSQTVSKIPTSQNSSRISNAKKFLSLPAQPPTVSPQAQIGNFTQGEWAVLGISYDKPIYYSYSVETSDAGLDAKFSIIAQGDLDGDQQYSRYEMSVRLNPNEQPLGLSQIYALDPLE